MAKDDYNFLVFKILTYLYACFRRRCHFETTAFMNREDLIEGLTFVIEYRHTKIIPLLKKVSYPDASYLQPRQLPFLIGPIVQIQFQMSYKHQLVFSLGLNNKPRIQ